MKYSKEQRLHAVEQMKLPHNFHVWSLSKRLEIPVPTLRAWRDAARRAGEFVPAGEPAENWDGQLKFQAVVLTSTFTPDEVSNFCNQTRTDIYDLDHWRKVCISANEPHRPLRPSDRKKIIDLQLELELTQEVLKRTREQYYLVSRANFLRAEEEAHGPKRANPEPKSQQRVET